MIIRQQVNTFKLLFSWRGTILPTVLPPLGVVMLLSTIIGGLEYYQLFHFPELPLSAFTLIGLVLSIFLGFKNNACYDRWWEARKLWGILIATARHMDRDCRLLPTKQRERCIETVLLFVNVLRDRLRQENRDLSVLTHLSAEDAVHFQAIKQHPNAPQYVLTQLQSELMHAYKGGLLTDICYVELNRHVHEMSLVHTGCDRIATTPIPFAYSVLLNRTIYCFCLMLPFALGNLLGLLTPLVVGLLAYTFLGLDALSSEIEEPFGTQSNDLPLDFMVRTIEIDLLSGLGRTAPDQIRPKRDNLL